jgi:copper(I)-binding protein
MRAVLATLAAGLALPALAAVDISGAWVRATVRGQVSSGAYLVIRSDRDVALVGVEADVAQHAAVHEMMMHDNMMMMTPVDRLVVPAGKPVVLDEHRYHVMLEDLTRQLKPGERVALRLHFVDGKSAKEEVKVSAVVRELSAGSMQADPMGHPEHMHDGMGHD